ncbi:NERD domain-containing protein [Candidatus Saccharibacteria bacterium]|nr:NERD domain-containing protein [Candidatus Saccharibacteria bacterium]
MLTPEQLLGLVIALVVIFFALSGRWIRRALTFFDQLTHYKEWNNNGNSGERALYRALLDECHIPEKHLFRNLYLKDMEGRVVEIDVVAVTRYGLLVFESKNYSGFVRGDQQARKWFHAIGRHIYKFPNPIRQNDRHIEALQLYLHGHNVRFLSVIIFTERLRSLHVDYDSRHTVILERDQLKTFYKHLGKNSSKMPLDRDELSRVLELLRQAEGRRPSKLRKKKPQKK